MLAKRWMLFALTMMLPSCVTSYATTEGSLEGYCRASDPAMRYLAALVADDGTDQIVYQTALVVDQRRAVCD